MIRIKNLTKHYGPVKALKNLDLHVPKGELFCFLGPNGAGKTTTIKILTGLLHPTSGTAEIGGIDIQKNPVEAKRLLGYVPDMPFMYDRLTTTEFFEFCGDLYDVDKNRVRAERDASFKLFGLDEHRGALVKDLSHGLRQRLIYASTFLHRPQVLFIDEPLVGLDPYTIRLLKDLLVEKTREGTTILLTTHILALAEDVGERIGIILKGRLSALGTLPELLESTDTTDLEEAFLKVTRASET